MIEAIARNPSTEWNNPSNKKKNALSKKKFYARCSLGLSIDNEVMYNWFLKGNL